MEDRLPAVLGDPADPRYTMAIWKYSASVRLISRLVRRMSWAVDPTSATINRPIQLDRMNPPNRSASTSPTVSGTKVSDIA
jgi:hypothetical protein